jgi:hypothetical protein
MAASKVLEGRGQRVGEAKGNDASNGADQDKDGACSCRA